MKKNKTKPRKIKFRAFPKSEWAIERHGKQMVYNTTPVDLGGPYGCKTKGIGDAYDNDKLGDVINTCLINYQLMQFTGLYDKNKTEIWEDDLVMGVWHGTKEDKEVFGRVECKEGMFGIENEHDGESYSLNRLDVEVIGNFWEYPEVFNHIKQENETKEFVVFFYRLWASGYYSSDLGKLLTKLIIEGIIEQKKARR